MPRSPLTALLGLSLALAHAGAAQAAEGPGPVEASVAAQDRGKPANKVCKRRVHRGTMLGRVVSDRELLTSPPPRPSGDIRVYSINYKEELKTNIYNPDGSYNVEAAKEIAHVFRCRRTGEEHEIDPRLLTILSHVHDRFGGRPIELLSGYRFQRKMTSNHFHGTAADIRVAGVRPRDLRAFVYTLDAGGMGVGFYPRVGFIHLDVRPAPSFRWIDNSRTNPDSRDKQPPRGWKRKKLES
ncbi:MAG TPA: DUF882 domain-containing protein [Polyangia bacterium]|nr:DUF882 domain-containing protein [Polyangia bacterium]